MVEKAIESIQIYLGFEQQHHLPATDTCLVQKIIGEQEKLEYISK